MTAVNNLLDKYRKVCSITSDSALAESIGITRQGVHQWRKGISWPSEDHIITMAKRIDEPAERWFVAISADRATPEGRKLWLKLLQAAAALAAIYLFSRHSLDVYTANIAMVFAAHNSGTLYIMSTCVIGMSLAWLLSIDTDGTHGAHSQPPALAL